MIKLQLLKRASAILLAAALLLVALPSCGDDMDGNTAKTRLTVMSWNDDFREMVEKYYIPTHREQMKNVEFHWISCEITDYKKEVLERLSRGERIDLFLGNDKMATDFAANENIASLTELGITPDELSEQYHFTRVLGSDAQGVQKGSAFNAEPGILVYRADYAEQYLGITHQHEMQEQLSSWNTFLATAQTLKERSDGKIKLLANSAEIWKSIDCAMSGLWLSEGQLAVSDETAARWLDYIKSLNGNDAFLNVNSFDDDWYNAIDDGVFCFFSAPWLNKSVSWANADITTIFTSSQKSGRSFGKFNTSLAPNGFVYGGTWMYSSKNSANKDISAEIIRAFTCDGDFMRRIALSEMEFVNNSSVINALAADRIPNPLFDGLDAFSAYIDAAKGLELSSPSVYDSEISRLLYNQTSAYNKGQITADRAIYNFRYNVWKKFETITSKPEEPVTDKSETNQ